MAVHTGGLPVPPGAVAGGFIAPPTRDAGSPGSRPSRWGQHELARETPPATIVGGDPLPHAIQLPPVPPPSLATEIPAPEPEPINPEPPSDPFQEDDEGYILVKLPKAVVVKLIQETIMSNNAKNNQTTAAEVNADTTATAPAAAVIVEPVVTVPAEPAVVASVAAATKKKTWLSIGTNVGFVLLGAGLTVGVQLLAKRYNLPLPPVEGGEVEA